MFINRQDAGRQLAEALSYYKKAHPLVLAIPRGGVEVAYYVAQKLGCQLSTVITRKLGHPYQPELAFGALAEDKSLYLNPAIRQKLSKAIIENAISREEKEIKRRIALYRRGKAMPPIKDRTVILVDDGIATGATLFAAIALCKKRKAGSIVVAVPIAAMELKRKLQHQVDDVVILKTPPQLTAVSQGYKQFENLTDEEVVRFLQRMREQSEVPNH